MFHRWYAAIKACLLIGMFAPGCTSAPTAPPHAEAPQPSPLIAQHIAAPKIVMASDGLRHVLYELLLVNQSPFSVKIETVSTVNPQSAGVLSMLAGADLSNASRLTLLGGDGTALQPSQSSLVFADVILPGDVPTPATILSRITATQIATAENSGTLGGLTVSPQTGAQPTVTFDTRPMPLDTTSTIILAPPVRGSDWIVFRGCCDVLTSHRGGTGIYDGDIRITERFALDLVKTDEAGMLVTGPANNVGSYPQYGARVYAVADGTVVSSRNSQRDEIPGGLNNSLSEREASGNSVVLKIAEDRYVLYAHLQAGSVRVEPGDVIRKGDEIGRIGNSGKTFAPHLHLHVSSSADPGGDGLPFVISSFSLIGRLTQDPFVLAQQGRPAKVVPDQQREQRFNSHPLNNDVLAFDG